MYHVLNQITETRKRNERQRRTHARTKTDRADAPFLELDLARVRAGLRGDELLEVADGVVRAALDPDCIQMTGRRRGQQRSEAIVSYRRIS